VKELIDIAIKLEGTNRNAGRTPLASDRQRAIDRLRADSARHSQKTTMRIETRRSHRDDAMGDGDLERSHAQDGFLGPAHPDATGERRPTHPETRGEKIDIYKLPLDDPRRTNCSNAATRRRIPVSSRTASANC